MEIRLQRTQAPEDMRGEPCGICSVEFTPGVVRAQVVTRWEEDAGVACEECVEFIGRHPSGRFPTIAEYRRLQAEWVTPEYASVRELERVEGPYA
jgi:hypothetical protein